MRDHISHTAFETSEQDDTLDGALQPATPRARAQRSPTVTFGEPQPSRAAMEEDAGGARGACALLTPEASGRGAEDGAVGGRIAAGLERGLSDDGLRGCSSVLNTSHQEVFLPPGGQHAAAADAQRCTRRSWSAARGCQPDRLERDRLGNGWAAAADGEQLSCLGDGGGHQPGCCAGGGG